MIDLKKDIQITKAELFIDPAFVMNSAKLFCEQILIIQHYRAVVFQSP